MKKILLAIIVFLVVPISVHAANLTTGINIDGFGDLGLTRNTYNLTLHTTLDYSTIIVSTADGASATVTDGNGNVVTGDKVPIQEGSNQISIVVSDGTNSENWTINLNVDREMEVDSDNPSTGTFISYISLGILVILGLGMYSYSKNKIMKKI